MVILFYLFALTLAQSTYRIEPGSDYKNWFCQSCSGDNCVTTTDGVLKLSAEDFITGSNWPSNTIQACAGETVELTFDIDQSANFWLKGGSSANKATYKFIMPENGKDFAVTFQENDGALNDVEIKFLKSTTESEPSLMYMKSGAGYQNKIKYVFEYELDVDEVIDFTKYKIPVWQENPSYTLSFENVALALNQKAITNIAVDQKLDFPKTTCDNTNCNSFRRSKMQQGWFYNVIYTKTENIPDQTGYVSEIETDSNENQHKNWYYSHSGCTDDVDCIKVSEGKYKFSGKDFIGASDKSFTNTIEACDGHTIDVNFDIQQPSDFYFKGGLKNEKVTFVYNIPVTTVSYSISFEGNQGALNNVNLNFLKNVGVTTPGIVSLIGGKEYSPVVTYALTYDNNVEQTDFSFNNYMTAVWKTNKEFSMSLNQVKFEMNTATETNLALDGSFQNPSFIESGLFEIPFKYTFDQVEKEDYFILKVTKEQTEPIKGYQKISGNKYVYSENVDPNNVYITENEWEENTFYFSGEHFEQTKDWPKSYIQAEGGHIIKISFGLEQSMNLFLSKGNVITTTDKVKFEFTYIPINYQFGIFFEKSLDGQLEDVDLILNRGNPTYGGTNVYMHNGCEWLGENCPAGKEFTTPINYKISYDYFSFGEDQFEFKQYLRLCFQDAFAYTMEVTLPVAYVFEAQQMNLFGKIGKALPGDIVQGEGDDQKTQKFSFGEEAAHNAVGHLSPILINTEVKEDENAQKYTGYLRQAGTYSYSFSQTISENQLDRAVLPNDAGRYEFKSDQMNPEPWQPTTVYPEGETKVDLYFDRPDDESAGDKQPSVKLYLATIENIDSSQAQILIVVSPTRLKNEFIVQQQTKEFTNRLRLKFEKMEYTTDISGAEIYVKGNAVDNHNDIFENVKYQIEYDYDGEYDVDFKNYKTIYLQEYNHGSDGSIGLQIDYIFFSGYYPTFEEPTETNIKANIKAECYLNNNQGKYDCSPPTQIKTKPYNIDEINAIVYTLSYDPEDVSDTHIPSYFIKSELISSNDDYDVDIDFDGKPEDDKKDDDGASSLFILLISFILFMLF